MTNDMCKFQLKKIICIQYSDQYVTKRLSSLYSIHVILLMCDYALSSFSKGCKNICLRRDRKQNIITNIFKCIGKVF